MTGLKPALCDTRPESPAVGPFYIAGRLGHREKGWSWIKAQIEALMKHEGFPPPFVLYACTGPRRGRRVEGITPSSRWHRAAVDAFFDGQPAAMVPARAAESALGVLAGHYANDLDARAAALAGMGASA